MVQASDGSALLPEVPVPRLEALPTPHWRGLAASRDDHDPWRAPAPGSFASRPKHGDHVRIREVTGEVLLDAAQVDRRGAAHRLPTLSREYRHRPATVARTDFARHQAGRLHAIDEAREARAMREQSVGQFAHPQAAVGFVQLQQHVVPSKWRARARCSSSASSILVMAACASRNARHTARRSGSGRFTPRWP